MPQLISGSSFTEANENNGLFVCLFFFKRRNIGPQNNIKIKKYMLLTKALCKDFIFLFLSGETHVTFRKPNIMRVKES